MAVDHTENMDQSSQANLTIQIQQSDIKHKKLRRLIKENLEEVSGISIRLNNEMETINQKIYVYCFINESSEAMATNSWDTIKNEIQTEILNDKKVVFESQPRSENQFQIIKTLSTQEEFMISKLLSQLSNYLAPLLDMPQPGVSPNAFKQVLELFLSKHSQDRLRLILQSPCDRWYQECLLTTGHSKFEPVLIEYQKEKNKQSPRDFFKHLIPFFERAPIESAKDSNQISVEFNGQSFSSLYTTTTPLFNTHRLQSYMNAESNNNQMQFYNQKSQHLPAKPYGSLLNKSISTEQDGFLTTLSFQQSNLIDINYRGVILYQ